MVSDPARPTTCPNCEQVYDPSRTTYCDKCGERFPWAIAPEPLPGLMVTRLLLGIGAALVFVWVGITLVNRTGDDFANLMGWFSFGMALVALAVALPRD